MKKHRTLIVISLLIYFVSTLPVNALASGFSYGKYCGAGTSTTAIPKDKLDAICKAHDNCCECSSKLNLSVKGKLAAICASPCNSKLISKLSNYIDKKCGLDDIAKGKKRMRACGVARAGMAYALALGYINWKQFSKCTVSGKDIKNKKRCHKELMSCINKVSWPSIK